MTDLTARQVDPKEEVALAAMRKLDACSTGMAWLERALKRGTPRQVFELARRQTRRDAHGRIFLGWLLEELQGTGCLPTRKEEPGCTCCQPYDDVDRHRVRWRHVRDAILALDSQ